MGVSDLVHKGMVLGLVGVTLYYGTFVAFRSGDVITRYRAQKAGQELPPNAAQLNTQANERTPSSNASDYSSSS